MYLWKYSHFDGMGSYLKQDYSLKIILIKRVQFISISLGGGGG